MTTSNLINLESDFKTFTNYELVNAVRLATVELANRAKSVDPVVPVADTAVAKVKKLSERDIAIKLSKEVIEINKRYEGCYAANGKICNVEFIVNKEKRTVVAIFRGRATNKIWARGVAKCDPSDVFNVHIGKAIALLRGMNKVVPNEILQSPCPTELHVGDIVSWGSKSTEYVIISVDDKLDNNGQRLYGFKATHGKFKGDVPYTDEDILSKLIDDSRE